MMMVVKSSHNIMAMSPVANTTNHSAPYAMKSQTLETRSRKAAFTSVRDAGAPSHPLLLFPLAPEFIMCKTLSKRVMET